MPALLLLFAAPARASGIVLATTATGGGPMDSRAAIALQSHRVHAVVNGPIADVTVDQTFRNETDRRLEGTYLFPLPEGAAVSKFAMTLGGRMVEGEVMDAVRAREIYESVVRRRRDPGLLEYVGRGLFRARVFPIEPRGRVDIRLSFQQVLPDDAGTLEFRYPLATARMHGQPVEETVVTVDVESDVPIRAVYSPSHPVALVREEADADGTKKPVRIAFLSDDWRALSRRDPKVARFLALGPRVVFRWEGRVYEVVPPERADDAGADRGGK